MIKFGTGGWRAIIGEDFTFYNVKKVGIALAKYIKKHNLKRKVIVGHDLRFLSGRFSRALSEALAENGIEVLFIDKAAPTPMVMLAVKDENLDIGATVTASHNPPEYNGIKVFVNKGKDAPVYVTNELEKIIAEIGDYEYHRNEFFNLIKKKKIKYFNNTNQYVDSLLNMIDVEAIKQQNFHVLFNPMFGVAKDIMIMCLSTMRCSVDTMNAYRDTMFGLEMPAPNRESLRDMQVKMKKNNPYNLGIATDGDSDRVGLYDENGSYISGNKIFTLLYYYFLEYRQEKGDVVRDLSTTHVLDTIAIKYNQQAHEVPIGFKYISESMEKHNALIGGEQGGGLKFRGHIHGKDGILPALFIVEMLAKTSKSLSELILEVENKFGELKFGGCDYQFNKEKKSELINLLFKEKYHPDFSKINKDINSTSLKDGIKYYFSDNTWLSIRFSGTEPLLRIYTEMKNEDEISKVMKLIENDKEIANLISLVN